MVINYLIVDKIPEEKNLSENIMYIITEYCICVHLCFCGCKNKITEYTDTPHKDLSINNNTITFNNKFFNKNLNCQTLYTIKNNIVYIKK